jgi:hypothetical protein
MMDVLVSGFFGMFGRITFFVLVLLTARLLGPEDYMPRYAEDA